MYNLLFPPCCFGCNALLSGGEVRLCVRCLHQLPLTGHHFVEENEMDIDFGHLLSVVKCSSLMYFSDRGLVQSLLHQLKYRDQPGIGEWMAELAWASTRIGEVASEIDLIVPVPLTPSRLRQRGYNQLSRFARTLSRPLRKPVAEEALRREDGLQSQSWKGLNERWSSHLPQFVVPRGEVVENRGVLLLDDVCTTGATLHSCIRALERSGVGAVYVLCMAMVGDH